jgi:hypothetical protein
MADKKISLVTQKTTLDYNDLIPVAKASDSTAYSLTGAAIRRLNTKNKTGNYTITAADNVIRCNGTFSVFLPPAT